MVNLYTIVDIHNWVYHIHSIVDFIHNCGYSVLIPLMLVNIFNFRYPHLGMLIANIYANVDKLNTIVDIHNWVYHIQSIVDLYTIVDIMF